MSFKINDQVSWVSSSNGSTKKKIGKIEAVIQPGNSISYSQSKETGSFSSPRNHESYLVRTPTKSGKGKGTLYWPRASALILES